MNLKLQRKEKIGMDYKDESKPYYKGYEQVSLGVSVYAALCLIGATKDYCLKSEVLLFGGVSKYDVYVVDRRAIIPPHYKLIYTFNHWLKIYDDFELTNEFHADQIHIFRAGDYDCIIQLM